MVVVVGGVGDCSGCWWWFQFVGMDFVGAFFGRIGLPPAMVGPSVSE